MPVSSSPTEVRDKLLGLRDALRRRGAGGLSAATLPGPFLYDALVLSAVLAPLMLYRPGDLSLSSGR